MFIFLLTIFVLAHGNIQCMDTSVAFEDDGQKHLPSIALIKSLCLKSKNPLECLYEIDKILPPTQQPLLTQKVLLAQPDFVNLLIKVFLLIKELIKSSTLHTLPIPLSLINRFSPFMTNLLRQRFIAHHEQLFDQTKLFLADYKLGSTKQTGASPERLAMIFLPNDKCVTLAKESTYVLSLDSQKKRTLQNYQTYHKNDSDKWLPNDIPSLKQRTRLTSYLSTSDCSVFDITEYDPKDEQSSKLVASITIPEIKDLRFRHNQLLTKLSHNKKMVAIVAGSSKIDRWAYGGCFIQTKLHIWLWDIKKTRGMKVYEKSPPATWFRSENVEIVPHVIKFSRDDELLFVSGNFGYLLFNIMTKKASHENFSISIHSDIGTFNRDGLMLIIANNQKNILHCLETKTGKVVFQRQLCYRAGTEIVDMKISHDELTFAFLSHSYFVLETKFDNISHLLFKMLLEHHLQLKPKNKNKIPPQKLRIAQLLAKNRLLLEQKKPVLRDLPEHITASNNVPIPLLPQQALGKPFWCLAINGGGVDTLVSAAMLKKIEEIAGCRIHNLFDCIVGTSCASLLALGLTASRDDSTPICSPAQFINYFYKFPCFSRPEERLKIFLQPFASRHRFSNSLTRVIIPYIETSPAYGPMGRLFDTQKAQSDSSQDCYTQLVARSSCGDGSFFPAFLNRECGSSITKSASNVYKNDAALFLYKTISHEKNRGEIHILSLSTGVMNENNQGTHELLTNIFDTSHYRNLAPLCNIECSQGATLDELDLLVKLGEKAIVKDAELILRIKNARNGLLN